MNDNLYNIINIIIASIIAIYTVNESKYRKKEFTQSQSRPRFLYTVIFCLCIGLALFNFGYPIIQKAFKPSEPYITPDDDTLFILSPDPRSPDDSSAGELMILNFATTKEGSIIDTEEQPEGYAIGDISGLKKVGVTPHVNFFGDKTKIAELYDVTIIFNKFLYYRMSITTPLSGDTIKGITFITDYGFMKDVKLSQGTYLIEIVFHTQDNDKTQKVQETIYIDHSGIYKLNSI